MSVAAIVLAAGLGRRFGAMPKGLARFDGVPLVRRAALTALASRAEPVLVVLGHEADALAAVLADLPVRRVDCPDYADGLSASLKAGFAALPTQTRAAVVCLADMPLVGAGVIDALIDAHGARPDAAAIVPVHDGERGNPVLLTRRLAPDIARLAGDRGAGPILRGRTDVVDLPWSDDTILCDADTPERLAALEARA